MGNKGWSSWSIAIHTEPWHNTICIWWYYKQLFSPRAIKYMHPWKQEMRRESKKCLVVVFSKLFKSCFLILISSPQVGKEGMSHDTQDFYIQLVALKQHAKPNKQMSYVEHEYVMAFVSSGCHCHQLYNSCLKISFQAPTLKSLELFFGLLVSESIECIC